MERIEGEASRMTGLVDDLLLLARLDDQRPLELEDVDLVVLSAETVHDARARAPHRSIQLAGLDGDLRPAVVRGDDGRLRAWVAGSERLRDFAPGRLDAVETMHAMTIHKSQGSQAERVTVLLPDETSRLLTRELFYTAVTRAQEHVRVVGSEASVRAANNCIQAYGGYGYVDEYPGGKYLRDARVTTLYEGTSQIQKLIIGRALTGINAF